jgi:hypothetical protein
MNTLLSRLGSFALGITGACNACNIDWKQQAEQAKTITRGYFDGLCLDCMDKSKPPHGKDPDELYCTHLSSENGDGTGIVGFRTANRAGTCRGADETSIDRSS